MYYNSRSEAGQKLADELSQYKDYDCVVLALGGSAVEVAEPVARSLNAPIAIFLSESIDIPGENIHVGSVNQDGGFIFSDELSHDEVQNYYGEFHSYIDEQKRQKFQDMNRLIGKGGIVDRAALSNKIVIVVADGLRTGSSLAALSEFLKPVHLERLVISTPVASVPAVDRMHIMGDELHCLSVAENYLSTKHYYNDTDPIPYSEAVKRIESLN